MGRDHPGAKAGLQGAVSGRTAMTGHRETVRHVDQTERMREPPPDPHAVSYESPPHSQEPIKASSTLVAEQVPPGGERKKVRMG